MNRKEKEAVVKDLEDKFSKCTSSVFAEFKGLNVQRMETLRKASREAQVDLFVIKNTLAKRAFESIKIEGAEKFFVGSTAVAFSWEDPITPIKVLNEYTKDNPELILKGGVVEGKIVDQDKIKALANLPPREILMSQVLAGMQSPLRGLVNTLSGPIRGLINCLKALEQQKS